MPRHVHDEEVQEDAAEVQRHMQHLQRAIVSSGSSIAAPGSPSMRRRRHFRGRLRLQLRQLGVRLPGLRPLSHHFFLDVHAELIF